MSEVIISSPEGRIEGKYNHSAEPNAPTALILHPHPLHGGTMNNKVVYNVYHTFVRNGFSTLRINFRGVGKSSGTFDNGVGELIDAAIALDWLQLQNPSSNNFWIAGFSFGAWIAMQLLMRRPEIHGFVAVSPPANLYDFSFLSPCPSSGLVVGAEKDSVAPEESISKLLSKISKQKNTEIDYQVIPGADHFYRLTMDDLVKSIDDYIKKRFSEIQDHTITKVDRRRRRQPVE
ncbi:MAG: alpha/beta hydrolase [Sphingobacteriia bacterium]|nr:alpha/beta hydrolase [Sphingobacteriia bacterium]